MAIFSKYRGQTNKLDKSLPLPQSPSGFMGRLFGKLMEWTNTGAYQRAIETLAPAPNECLLEIGFGTGRCAELLLSAYPDIFVAGIDPTPTMVQTAIERLTKLGLCHCRGGVDPRDKDIWISR